jgi:DNA-binding CsgD family transcriptional regulator
MRSITIAATNAFMGLFPEKNDARQKTLFKTEMDQEIILQQLLFAENLFPDSAITACPVSHPGISYFSKNCAHILGHPYERLVSLHISQFFNLIHPDDLPYVRQCFSYIKSMEPYDPAEYRFSIYFRFGNAAGEYIHIRNENIAIRTGDNAYLYLMLFCNITDKKFYQVRMETSRKQKGIFTKVSSFNPRQGSQLITPRQRDIAELIARGYANQEIAEQLNVSIYTVKNHKQQLFRKANVKSSIELANFIRSRLEPASITN